jgi:formylglycine-generating enzyme required for sulfatase activity
MPKLKVKKMISAGVHPRCVALRLRHAVFLANLVFSFYLLVCPTTAYSSDVLHQIDVLENLRFNSSASDGKHFIFTRYDATGNRYELVFYDLKEKKPVIIVPDLPSDTRYLFSDAQQIFVIDTRSPKEIILINRKDISQRNKIILDKGFSYIYNTIFTLDDKLYIIQSIDYRTNLWLIYDLKTFDLLYKKETETAKVYHLVDNHIIGIGNQIVVYDKDANPIHRSDNKLQCQLGMSGTVKGRLFFSDICGKIYEYDIKTYERKTVFDLGALDIRSGLHKFSALNFDINEDGLLIAVHSNKESYPKLIDINSGRLLKTLTVKNIPDFIMIDNYTLYFIYSDWLGKKSKIEVYSIDKSALYSDKLYAEHLKKEHERALQLYRETKDFYNAIEVMENADILSMIKGESQMDSPSKITILNDYAYFLFLTYDRYKEAIPLLEQTINLSKDRASAYINMADVYYKLYKYEKTEKETLQKANDYYEIYKRLMNEKGQSGNILKRNFMELEEKSLVQQLNIDINGTNLNKLLFWKDKIFAGEYDCYGRDSTGNPKVYVYNRDDYSLIKELILSECDTEQQDTIGSLTVKDNKLFITTGYRYEDDKRPNLFVYDLKTFESIGKSHSEEKDEDYRKDFFGLDLSYTDKNDTKYLKDFILGGKKFERLKGSYGANNKNYLVASGRDKEKKFHIYNLSTLERNEDIELSKERASFLLFDDFSDKIAIRYFTSPKTLIEIYDIKNKQRRNILSFDNDSGGLITIIPVLQTYKHYLIVAYRRDIIFYDTNKMEITEVVKNVIPEYKSEGERKVGRINNLVIDNERQRLLIFTLAFEQYNSFVDLDFLERLKLGYRSVTQPKRAAKTQRAANAIAKIPETGASFKDAATGMKLIFVKGGCYQMGDAFGDAYGYNAEKPVHEVCVDNFYMGEAEVTQRQWFEIVGSNPSYFKNCDDCPVENVSWRDTQEYINKLNQETGKKYRLPTEAEWEYAARSGGKREKYAGGDDIDSVGWYRDNSGGKTHPVKQKKPNGLGLYDMSGNVWEWAQDIYASDAYEQHSRNNPIYNIGRSSSDHVSRGGCWVDGAHYLRASSRSYAAPRDRSDNIGFRLAAGF